MKTPKDCPLWFHKGSGQWARKVRGKRFYFGTELDAALKRWATEKDDILAGLNPKRKDGRPTVTELGNVFIAEYRKLNATTGKPGERHIKLCKDSIARLIGIVGADKRAEDLGPLDFANIKLKLFEPVKRSATVRGQVFGRTVDQRSPETVAGDVRRIKAFLNWCADSEYIPPPRYGKQFKPATEVAITKQSLREQSKRKDLSAADLQAILAKCSIRLKPLVLLGLNGGVGNGDLAAMELADIKGLKAGFWLDLPRGKTGIERRFPLWPETVQAIKDYLAVRPEPYSDKYRDVLFLTGQRLPWVRGDAENRVDSLGMSFTKARKAAGLKRGAFYDLRRTLQTIGDETRDFPAVRAVMGHAKPKQSMSDRYNQHISDERIKAVCEHVRRWFNG